MVVLTMNNARRFVKILFLALIACLTWVLFEYTVFAQNRLDPNLRPQHGTVRMDENSWKSRIERENRDYFSVRVAGNSGRVNLNGIDCSGFTTSQPSYVIQWKRFSITEDERLRLFFVGKGDTSLAVLLPDGTLWCNNDSFRTTHPTIDIERPRSGNYTIWVGAERANSSVDGFLYVTLGTYSPADYPLLVDNQFRVTGVGAGYTSAQLIYVALSESGSALLFSVDMVLANMQGDETIRIGIWPRVAVSNEYIRFQGGRSPFQDNKGNLYTYSEIQPAFGNTVYDYFPSSDEPILLTLPIDFLTPGNIYHFDVHIQLYDSQGAQWLDLDTYQRYGLNPLTYEVE